jgi:O-acetylserine/cysteine efflux transporter
MAIAMNDPSHTERFGSLDIVVVIVMNVMWGLNLIAVKMAVDVISPMTAALIRQVIVLCICLPFLKLVPGRMRELITLGFLSGALFYVFVNWSLAISDNVSALAIAGQLGAPFSLILAVLVLKERIHAYRIIGTTLSFLGVMLLVFDPAIADEMPGMLLTIVASAVWAICSLIQRRLKGTPVLTIYAWVGLVGSAFLLPIAWAVEPDQMASISSLPLSALAWVSFSAIGSTVIGQGAMSWLMQRHPVSVVVPLTLPTPVISVIASTLYFNTPLTPVMILGGIIVLIGVGIVTIRTARAREGTD